MEADYFIYYTESNMFCLIIFGILLVHDLLNADRQEKQIKYDRCLVAFMLYFLSDSFYAAVIAGVVSINKYTILIANFANYIIMNLITYSWLRYVLAVEMVEGRSRFRTRTLLKVPFIVYTLTMFLVYWIDPGMLLNDKLEVQPLFTMALIIVPIINILVMLFYVLKKAKNKDDPYEMQQHLYVGFFPFFVLGGGLFQVIVLPNTPVFCFCSTVMMLMFYIQSMETKISMDALTKLNNRGQLQRYIAQASNTYKDDRHTFVIMLDVNDFKMINDSYGHAEGDKALMIIADSLKKVVNGHNVPAFIGRYGGDEFIVIVHPSEENGPETLIAEIRADIENRCRDNETPYIISIGAGYDELGEKPDTFSKCIQRADKKLYLDKEYIKLQRH